MAQEKPLKVLILAGQSNMQGHAHVRTFDPMGLDPKTAPILKEMRNADGTPRVCEKVWISSIGCAEEGKAALDKLYAETFTPREMEILKKSTSNFDFHYMGSAKIMAQIGKGFAESLFETMEGHNHE